MRPIDRTKLIIFMAIRLSVVIAFITAVLERNWVYLGLSVFTLLVLFIPSIIERKFQLDISAEFEIVLAAFIYAGTILGEFNQFYHRFWWWDKMLHGFSGLILGNIGFLIINYLISCSKVNIKLNPAIFAFFCFCFAVAMGAIWEIYEYSMDNIFGMFMQKGSLDDTMTDIILDTAGALIFAVLGYFQQKGGINLISKYIIKINNPKN